MDRVRSGAGNNGNGLLSARGLSSVACGVWGNGAAFFDEMASRGLWVLSCVDPGLGHPAKLVPASEVA